MPDGVRALIAAGYQVTVEESRQRAEPIAGYRDAGAQIVGEGTWPDAPRDAIILGLKELPEDGSPLPHRHVTFGHAFKGQPDGPALLRRFRDAGGALYDLEYLVDDQGRRSAAFGYWAGFAGAAVSLMALGHGYAGRPMPPVTEYNDQAAMVADVQRALDGMAPTKVIIIGAKGRVGGGAADLCDMVNAQVTPWDVAETAHGGPFLEIRGYDVFLNCILAGPNVPVFMTMDMAVGPRLLRVIGDIACDPASDYTPIKVNDRITDWQTPVRRVHDAPPLDVMAIDNLPSLLPRESSADFAEQLLPLLLRIDRLEDGEWARAGDSFQQALAELVD
jgi:saccharopine dehydrogenase (NAD+, L-lysine-forming)